jgi:hypothetical protein
MPSVCRVGRYASGTGDGSITVECSDYLKRKRVGDVLDLQKKLQRGRCVLASHAHPCAFASRGTFCTDEKE